MNRNSTTARETASLLIGEHGFTEPSTTLQRRIQRYSQTGLLPPGKPTAPEIARHIARSNLSETFRPGPGAVDRAILALAGRGYACAGLPAAIERALGPSHIPEWLAVRPDPTTDEGDRAIGAEVRDLTQLLDQGSPILPTLMAELLGFVNSEGLKAYKQAPIYDEVKGTETPEQSRASAWQAVLGIYYGGGAPTVPETIDALKGLGAPAALPADETPDDEVAEEILDRIIDDIPNVEAEAEAARLGSAEELAQGAHWIRQHVFSAPGFEARWGAEELDVLAGMLAPIGTALSHLPWPPGLP